MDQPATPNIGPMSPFFIVRNVSQAINFYQARLGFDLRYAEPKSDPFFAIVGRDTAQLFVKHTGVDPQPNPSRRPGVPWDAFVYVPDPDALAAEFASRATPFHAAIRDRHDGLRGFEIADPDGYVLFFGRPR